MNNQFNSSTFIVGTRMIPIHYYPIEYQIVSNNNYLMKLYLDKKFVIHNPNCFLCHNNENLEVHHCIEIMNLGNNKRRNLILLCYECHKKLHNDKTFNPAIPIDTSINNKLLKIKRKLLLKLYRQDNSFIKRFFPKDFVYKHLELNNNIKYLLHKGMNERLKEYKTENNIK